MSSSKVWEDIKKGVGDSITFATEKTKELAAVSKLKLAISGINRKIDLKFKKLGKHVYAGLEKGEGDALAKDEHAKELISQIKELETELSAKEQELAEIGKKEEQADEEGSEGKAVEKQTESN